MNTTTHNTNDGANSMNLIDITDYTDAEIDALLDAPRVACPKCGAANVARPYTHTWHGVERIDYLFEETCSCGAELEGEEWTDTPETQESDPVDDSTLIDPFEYILGTFGALDKE
jgi:hypothetical protein